MIVVCAGKIEKHPPRAASISAPTCRRRPITQSLGRDAVLLSSLGLHERGHDHCRQNKNNDDGECLDPIALISVRPAIFPNVKSSEGRSRAANCIGGHYCALPRIEVEGDAVLDARRNAGSDGLRLVADTTNQSDMKPPCARRKPGHRAGLSFA
jgi:hypothetical protein